MNPSPKKTRVALALSCILALSACGGASDEVRERDPAPPPVISPTPQQPPAEPAPPPPAFMPTLSPNPTLIGNGAAPGAVSWPDGSTATGGRGATVDGILCHSGETYHAHAHLTIIRNGVMMALPANVGLQGCTYELHTHDRWGVIHVETSAYRKFTLGQFFAVWGQPLSRTNVAGMSGLPVKVFIDDDGRSVTEHTGDIAGIELTNQRSITIQIGAQLQEIPSWRW